MQELHQGSHFAVTVSRHCRKNVLNLEVKMSTKLVTEGRHVDIHVAGSQLEPQSTLQS